MAYIQIKPMGFTIARIIAIGLLVWAIDRHPYGYYKLLRFIICAVSAYGFYFSTEIKKTGWAWIFGGIAILFNPIIQFHLGRQIWAFVDLGVATIFVISLFLLRNAHQEKVP
jgi:hypothetical protein